MCLSIARPFREILHEYKEFVRKCVDIVEAETRKRSINLPLSMYRQVEASRSNCFAFASSTSQVMSLSYQRRDCQSSIGSEENHLASQIGH